MDSHADDQAREDDQTRIPLYQFSPRRLAKTIRSLDSRLVSVVYEVHDGKPILIYTFEMAGKRQSFHVAATPSAIESICDLYPEAATFEHALGRHGLSFHPPADD